MMTVTEYKKYVQDKKSAMLETADKNLNSQKQIALITLGEHYDNFIIKIREVFEEFGYVVHWYHYNNETIKQLDMGIEIADLRPHYYQVFVFDTEIDWRFADAAYQVACRHVNKDAESLCVIGSDDRMAARFVSEWLRNGKRIIGKPVGVSNLYSDIFDSDMTFIFDRKVRINCYPIHKPIYYIFSWSIINQENKQAYDLCEEIILEVIANVNRRESSEKSR
jgi:hypothetical protein